jgi:tetratricopeptide (TPR) repeat protein
MYVDQVLRVRPYDSEVHYAVGERAWMAGQIETAVKHWQVCFKDTGPHQLRVIYWLAGRMPADLFLSVFQPEWNTLPHIWGRYRKLGQPNDAKLLLAYAAEATKRELKYKIGARGAEVLLGQASMYRDVGCRKESLACLQHAYTYAPTDFNVRLALAAELAGAERYEEAQPHYRWCLARHPADKSLSEALKAISKKCFARRELQTGKSQEHSSRLRANLRAATIAASHSSTPSQPKAK